MKKALASVAAARFLIAGAVAATLLAACAVAPTSREPVAVRLIGINDFHGNLESTNLSLSLLDPADQQVMRVNTGGAAALAGTVKALRAGSPHSLVIGAGDLFGAAPLASTLFRQESAVEILNDVGLEVSSLGNHEFDFGVAELKRLIAGGCAPNPPENPATSCAQGSYAGARFEYLGANVLDAGGKPIVAPYAVRHFDGVPLAIIGAVTKATPTLVTPSGVAGLSFLDEAEAVNRAAAELRARGIRAMVAVFHEGITTTGSGGRPADWNDTSCPGAAGPLLDIASRLAPEIRVVFSGHTHWGYRCEVRGRLLIQGTAFGRGVSVVDVELDRGTHAMRAPVRSLNLPVFNEATDPVHRAKLIAATPEPFRGPLSQARPDEQVAAKVAAYAALVKPKAERVIARVGGAFPHSRSSRADTPAGRLIADAQLAASRAEGAQLALMNPGGVRASFNCSAPPCDVTFGHVFTVQPFGNSVVVMDLTGAQLKRALEQQWRAAGEPYLLSPSKGFTFTWDEKAPRGEQVRDMRLDGAPIEPAKTYRVAVNSFLADGGDGFSVFREGANLKGAGQDIDALMAYLAAEQRNPDPAARITRR